MVDLTNGYMKAFTNIHLDHEHDRVNNPEENWCDGAGANRSELGPGEASLRRSTIAYIFKTIFNSQSEDQWEESGLVGKIMKRIGIPEGSRLSVRNVLRDMVSDSPCMDACRSEVLTNGGRRVGIKASVAESYCCQRVRGS